jgi:hypothetical protein
MDYSMVAKRVVAMVIINKIARFAGLAPIVIPGVFGLVGSLFIKAVHPGEAFQDWQWDEKQKSFGVVLKNRDGLESPSLKKATLYVPKNPLPPRSVRLHLGPSQSVPKFNSDTFPEVIKRILSTVRLTFTQFLYKIEEDEPCYLPADPLLRQINFGLVPESLTLEMNETGNTAFLKTVKLRMSLPEDVQDRLWRWFQTNISQDRIEPSPVQTMIDFFQKSPRPRFYFNLIDLLPAFAAVDLEKELVVFPKEQLPLIEKSVVEENGNPILLAKEFYYIPRHIYDPKSLKIKIRLLSQDLKKRAVGLNGRKGFFNSGFYFKQADPREDFVMSFFSEHGIKFFKSLREELASYSTDFDPKHLYIDKGRAATSDDDDRLSVTTSLTSTSWSDVSSALRSEKSMAASSRFRFQGEGFPAGELQALPKKAITEQKTQFYGQQVAEADDRIYMLHGTETFLKDILFLYSDGEYLYLTKTLSRRAIPFNREVEATRTKEKIENIKESLDKKAYGEEVKEILNKSYSLEGNEKKETNDSLRSCSETLPPQENGAAATPTESSQDALEETSAAAATESTDQFIYTTYLKEFALAFFSKDGRFLERSPDGKLQYRFSLPMGGYAAFMDKTGPEDELRLVPLSNNYKYEKDFQHAWPYYPLHQLNPQQPFLYEEQYHAHYQVFLKTKSLLELLKKHDAEFFEIYDLYQDFLPFLTASISLENKAASALEHAFFSKKPDLGGLLKELSEGKLNFMTSLSKYRKITNDEDLFDFPYLLKLYTTSSDESLKPADALLASSFLPTSTWKFHKGCFVSPTVELQMDNWGHYNYLNYIPLFSAHDLNLRIQVPLAQTWEELKTFMRLARPGWYSQFSFRWYLIEENEDLKKMLEAHLADAHGFIKQFFKQADFFERVSRELSSLNQNYELVIDAPSFNEGNRRPLNEILLKHEIKNIRFKTV